MMGRALIGIGAFLFFVGLAILALGRLGLPLGRLPGDFHFRRGGVQIFLPLATSLLLSVLLSLLLYVVGRLRR